MDLRSDRFVGFASPVQAVKNYAISVIYDETCPYWYQRLE
jgi:hypothetical protein